MRRSIFSALLAPFLGTLLFVSCTPPAPKVEYCECADWENWENTDDVRCGFITVPEDHNAPNGRQIKVAFAIFDSQGGDPSAPPTMALTGGPGGRSLSFPNRWTNHESRQVGDLIVVEQRGIGLSSGLPDINEDIVNIVASNSNMEQERALHREMLARKSKEISATGVNLAKYNSTENAKDFGMLMEALPYSSYNLYGTSYGTKLGMTIMKYFPEKIHASILDGPAALNNRALERRFPDVKRSIDLFFERCANDPNCGEANLKEEMVRAIRSLEEDPITVTLLERDFTINPQDALFFIRYLLYRPDGNVTTPQFIKAINERDLEAVTELGQFPSFMLYVGNTAAFYSFNLYEEYSDDTPSNMMAFVEGDEILGQGLAWFQGFIPELTVWHNERASEEEKLLENIEVPTLVIVNEFDPVTPPANAKFFEDALTNEQVLRLNRFGHGSGGACISSIRNAFLLNPTATVDQSCLHE